MDKFFTQKVALWTFIACVGTFISRMVIDKYGPGAAGPLFLCTFMSTYVYARIIFILDQKKEVEKFLKDLKDLDKKD